MCVKQYPNISIVFKYFSNKGAMSNWIFVGMSTPQFEDESALVSIDLEWLAEPWVVDFQKR